MKALILLSLWCYPLLGLAAGESFVQTQSAGRYLADQEADLARELAAAALVETSVVSKPRITFGSQQPASNEVASRLAAHHVPVSFEIFDAWVVVSDDLDGDGYFHHLNVVLDADTSAALETVYVKLYLSRDGGDWVQYATSDLFEIRHDAVDDTYEVATELLEGFVPGQYDVLIELYSLFHSGIVASRIVTLDDDGFVITLEDLRHDEAARVVIVDDGYVAGSGSVSLPGLLMLALLVWLKLRYFSAKRAPDDTGRQK